MYSFLTMRVSTSSTTQISCWICSDRTCFYWATAGKWSDGPRLLYPLITGWQVCLQQDSYTPWKSLKNPAIWFGPKIPLESPGILICPWKTLKKSSPRKKPLNSWQSWDMETKETRQTQSIIFSASVRVFSEGN